MEDRLKIGIEDAPGTNDREMVEELTVRMQFERFDSKGFQLVARLQVRREDRTPFDRVDQKLRQTLHEDLDRVLNDLNRNWNQIMMGDAKMQDPFTQLLMKLTGGIPVEDTETEKKLIEDGRRRGYYDPNPGEDESSESEKAPNTPPNPDGSQNGPAS